MSDRPSALQSALARAGRSPATAAPTAAPTPPPVKPPPEEDEPEDCGSYGIVRGTRDRLFNIEFRLLEGQGPWPTPEYAFLKNTWWDAAKGEIRLEYTTGVTVTITGRGLRALKEKLSLHRVAWVEAKGKDPVADRADAHETRVYEITVQLPEDGEGEE